MLKKRKEVEEFIIKYVDKMLPGSENGTIYRDKLFKNMSDSEFTTFMKDLETGKQHLSIIAPNDNKHNLSTERNIKIAKELGHEFFHNLEYKNNDGLPNYIAPIKNLVFKIPFRRTSQLLIKKISVPIDDRSIDLSTYQPTNKSKGSKLSYVEIQMLAAMGLDKSIIELIKYRGGDKGGYKALKTMLHKHGTANQETLSKYATGVVSTDTLKAYFTGMHLKNNL